MTASTFSDYQDETIKTAVYPDAGEQTGVAIQYTALGLVGEAGEVANKVKKVLRDDDGELSDLRRDQIADEIGGVLWYCARLAAECGLDLGEIADENIEILLDRQSRGVIQGSGDNR